MVSVLLLKGTIGVDVNDAAPVTAAYSTTTPAADTVDPYTSEFASHGFQVTIVPALAVTFNHTSRDLLKVCLENPSL